MNERIITETSRFQLREMTEEDAVYLYQLNLDAEVIRYTGDVAFAGVEEARLFLRNYEQYRLYGLGRWAVINKADGSFVGWCGLKFTPAVHEYDIGFRFFRQYWGQGIATETARACIALAFNTFHIPVVVGRAMLANTASIKVLEKAGLTLRNYNLFEGQEGVVYTISRPGL